MVKVIQVIPYDGIGGVESASRTMANFPCKGIDFQVVFIFSDVMHVRQGLPGFNPLPFLAAACRVSRNRTNLLIVSLWRSTIVGLLVKILRPETKLVTFLHAPVDVHIIDRWCTRLSMLCSDEIWADSHATLSARVPAALSKPSRVISFVMRRFDPLPHQPITPSFIFWGRICQQKRLDRALHIFSEVYRQYPEARFLVVGPDGGTLPITQALCVSLGLENAVTFLGAASQTEIIGYARQASFYLQTSDFEGMAISVVEAMQLGLVPVITAVGEIANYCVDGHNAVVIESERQSVEAVFNLLDENDRYDRLRRNAIMTWSEKPLYRDSFFAACVEALRNDYVE